MLATAFRAIWARDREWNTNTNTDSDNGPTRTGGIRKIKLDDGSLTVHTGMSKLHSMLKPEVQEKLKLRKLDNINVLTDGTFFPVKHLAIELEVEMPVTDALGHTTIQKVKQQGLNLVDTVNPLYIDDPRPIPRPSSCSFRSCTSTRNGGYSGLIADIRA